MIKKCCICEKEFETKYSKTLTCSNDCKRLRLRQTSNNWKKRNMEKNKQITKEWRVNNKEHTKNYNKQYNIDNRETIQLRQTEQHKIRRKTDFNYKLSVNIRNHIYKFYKGNIKKSELIGCSWSFLQEWLSFLDKNATLQTHGNNGWHIDHVIPISLYDLNCEDQLRKCFHWSNLQPLNGIDNLSKGNKTCNYEIQQHKNKLNEFCNIKNIPVPN